MKSENKTCIALREATRVYRDGEWEIHLSFTNNVWVVNTLTGKSDCPVLSSTRGKLNENLDGTPRVIWGILRGLVPAHVEKQAALILVRKRAATHLRMRALFPDEGQANPFAEPGVYYVRNWEEFRYAA